MKTPDKMTRQELLAENHRLRQTVNACRLPNGKIPALRHAEAIRYVMAKIQAGDIEALRVQGMRRLRAMLEDM